jgi:hypothetical protein
MWTRKRLVFDMKMLADARREMLAIARLLNGLLKMVSPFPTQSK